MGAMADDEEVVLPVRQGCRTADVKEFVQQTDSKYQRLFSDIEKNTQNVMKNIQNIKMNIQNVMMETDEEVLLPGRGAPELHKCL